MPLTANDNLELHELAARYGDIIDDRDWQALDSIFTEDAVFEVVKLVTLHGRAEIKRYMDEDGRHPLAHFISNIHTREDNDDVRLLSRGVFPIDPEENSNAGHRVFYGSYYDEVIKTAAGWSVARRTFSAKRM